MKIVNKEYALKGQKAWLLMSLLCLVALAIGIVFVFWEYTKNYMYFSNMIEGIKEYGISSIPITMIVSAICSLLIVVLFVICMVSKSTFDKQVKFIKMHQNHKITDLLILKGTKPCISYAYSKSGRMKSDDLMLKELQGRKEIPHRVYNAKKNVLMVPIDEYREMK